jgi:arabinogalactan endo-1,4-beta-galactosidase
MRGRLFVLTVLVGLADTAGDRVRGHSRRTGSQFPRRGVDRAAVPNGRGLGVFYWDATWTGAIGNGWSPVDPSQGNACENQALIRLRGLPLPAMSEYRP